MQANPLLVDLNGVKKLLSLGRTKIYNLIKTDPQFPKPDNRFGKGLWHYSDLAAYAESFKAKKEPTDEPD